MNRLSRALTEDFSHLVLQAPRFTREVKNEQPLHLPEHVSLSMFVGQNLRVERKEDNIKDLVHRVGNSPFQGHYRSCVKREHQCFHADDSAEPTAISNLCSRIQSGIYLIHVSKT